MILEHSRLAFDAAVSIEMATSAPFGWYANLVGAVRVGTGLGRPVAPAAMEQLFRLENSIGFPRKHLSCQFGLYEVVAFVTDNARARVAFSHGVGRASAQTVLQRDDCFRSNVPGFVGTCRHQVKGIHRGSPSGTVSTRTAANLLASMTRQEVVGSSRSAVDTFHQREQLLKGLVGVRGAKARAAYDERPSVVRDIGAGV